MYHQITYDIFGLPAPNKGASFVFIVLEPLHIGTG